MFNKVRFSKDTSIQKAGIHHYHATLPDSFVTAALIVDSDKLNKMTISEISQMFPYSESTKMKYLEISANFETWEDAFNADFQAKRSNQVNII